MSDVEAEPTSVGISNNGTGPSIVDLVKQDITEAAQYESVMIPVPGYEKSGLRVKYTLPESGRIIGDVDRQVRRDFKDDYTRNLMMGVDVMIELCDGLYVQPRNPGYEHYYDNPVPLDDENGITARFDERLAELLGWTDVKTARSAVFKLFNNNHMAIIDHAARLNRWMQNTRADVVSNFWTLGE